MRLAFPITCSTVIALLFVVPSGSAFAGKSEARACAAKLPSEAKMIYDAVAPGFEPGADLEALVTDKTGALAIAGKVSIGTARGSAMAAAPCLMKLR